MEQIGSHWTDFHEILYLSIYKKFCREIKVSLKFDKKGVLYVKTCVRLWQYVAQFFLEWKVFKARVVQKIKTHFLFKKRFSENCAMYDMIYIIWRNVLEPRAT